MLKVNAICKTADFKAGKYIDENMQTVVASTKTLNNFVEELQESGKVVAKTTSKELYIDKTKTAQVLKDFVSKEFDKEDEQAIKDIVNHLIMGLDRVCAFYRPIKRSK